MIPLAGCSLPAGYTKVINQIFIQETTYITKDSFILEGATQLPQGCMIYWWCLLKYVKLSCDHHCKCGERKSWGKITLKPEISQREK